MVVQTGADWLLTICTMHKESAEDCTSVVAHCTDKGSTRQMSERLNRKNSLPLAVRSRNKTLILVSLFTASAYPTFTCQLIQTTADQLEIIGSSNILMISSGPFVDTSDLRQYGYIHARSALHHKHMHHLFLYHSQKPISQLGPEIDMVVHANSLVSSNRLSKKIYVVQLLT